MGYLSITKVVNTGEDITVCLPGTKLEDIAEKAAQVVGGGTGGAVLGTNNAEKQGTSAIVDKYSRLIKTHKEARIGQIVLSGILSVVGCGVRSIGAVGRWRPTCK